MIVLQYDKNGFPLYWIFEDDPLHGFSLWKRIDKNSSRVLKGKDIPARFRKYFNNRKDVQS